jgi:hypothetical protein
MQGLQYPVDNLLGGRVLWFDLLVFPGKYSFCPTKGFDNNDSRQPTAESLPQDVAHTQASGEFQCFGSRGCCPGLQDVGGVALEGWGVGL